MVSDADAISLHATHLPYQYCQTRAVEYCWPDLPRHSDDLCTAKSTVEEGLYDELGEETTATT